MAKITGRVKWFSNKKGFGFIEPTSENAPTKEDIFVHFSSINTDDGVYRTLGEGMDVEFDVETEESGKLKAVNVTSPGGGAVKPQAPERRSQRKKKVGGKKDSEKAGESTDDDGGKGDGAGTGDEGEKGTGGRQGRGRRQRGPKTTKKKESEPADREPPFHDAISDDKKALISKKHIELTQRGTVDVAFGDARIKLGQGGYAGIATAAAVVGEGTYTCDANAEVKMTWERSLKYEDGAWKPSGTESLPTSLNLTDDAVTPVKSEETPEKLWGEGKADPKQAFEDNGFLMRRVVLTRPRRPRGRNDGNRKDKKAAE